MRLQSLVDTVIGHFGKLDTLINNAAIAVQGHRIDDPNADFVELDQQWRVNVLGVVAAAGEALPPGLSDTMSIAHIATLEEVAASIAFFVGPDAGYITGAVLDISGGYQA